MRRARGWALASVVCLASLAGLGSGGGSARADDVDGWWYLTDYHVEAAWAKGYDGSGVTIALIDGPVDLRVPWLQGANIETFDNPVCAARNDPSQALPGTTTNAADAFHATNMIGLYAGTGDDGKGGPAPKGVAPKARILILPLGLADNGILEDMQTRAYACLDNTSVSDAELTALGLTREDIQEYSLRQNAAIAVQINRAIDLGADIIGMPFDTYSINPGSPLEKALLRAVREEVILVNSRENNTRARLAQVSSKPSDIHYFPGGLTVSSIDRDHSINPGTLTVDPGVDILAPSGDVLGTVDGLEKMMVKWGGNSAASAIMSGYIALLMNKWPDATGNQILHAVLATTLDGKGTATRDPQDTRGWGSFVFSYTNTDPATYPDTNPIFDYDLTRIIDYTDTYVFDENNPDQSPLADWGTIMAEWDPPAEYTLEAWWPDVMALHRDLDPEVSPSPSASAEAGQAEAPAASTGIPVWVWAVIAAALLVVVVAVPLVIVLSRRTKPPTPPSPAPGYRY